MKLQDFTEEKDFVDMEFDETIADLEDSEIFFNPHHVNIDNDCPVNLVQNGSTVTSGTWDEIVDYVAQHWGTLSGNYVITKQETGGQVYNFEVIR